MLLSIDGVIHEIEKNTLSIDKLKIVIANINKYSNEDLKKLSSYIDKNIYLGKKVKHDVSLLKLSTLIKNNLK